MPKCSYSALKLHYVDTVGVGSHRDALLPIGAGSEFSVLIGPSCPSYLRGSSLYSLYAHGFRGLAKMAKEGGRSSKEHMA